MKNFKKYLLLILIVFCIFGITNVNAKTVCKRATKLHKENCSVKSIGWCSNRTTAEYKYNKNDEIVYGNYGNSTSLATGDAFDCDVNGDGVFDPYKERFYYVTNLSTNNNYAVLLYYINTYNGQPNGQKGSKYHDKGQSAAYGPEIAKTHLPTASAWSNIALSSTSRDISYANGNVVVPGFSYDGYSSRLLTYQEVVAANCDGNTYKGRTCEFINENTTYHGDNYYKNRFTEGFWLDTANYIALTYYTYKFDAQLTFWSYGDPGQYSDYMNWGTRPAIEVKLDEIDTTLREHEENIYADQEQDTSKDSTNSTNKREEVVSVPDTAASVSKIILINAIICILVGITIISLNTIHKKKNKS